MFKNYSRILILIALLNAFVKSDTYSASCYDNNTTLSGVQTGTRVSDRPTLNETILNGTVSSSFTTAAVRSCVNNVTGSANFGALLGHQIAIANFSGLSIGIKPSTSSLIWFSGVGQTQDIQGSVKCYTKYLGQGDMLNSWSTAYNSIDGLYISNLTFSDGSVLNYGLKPTSPPSGSINIAQLFSFDQYNLVAGIWGWQSTSIEAISMITYNLTRCPLQVCQIGYIINPLNTSQCVFNSSSTCNRTTSTYFESNNTCKCNTGYTVTIQNPTNCVLIVTCNTTTQVYNSATNTCTCKLGYIIDPKNSSQCILMATCNSTTQVYNYATNTCSCNANSIIDPKNSSNCILIYSCNSTSQIYNSTTNLCTCQTNYVPDPTNSSNCVLNATCNSSTQVYNSANNSCQCKSNYVTNPLNNNQCVLNATCNSTSQDYNSLLNICSCKDNYVTNPLNSSQCVPIAICNATTQILNSTTNSCQCSTAYIINPINSSQCVPLAICDQTTQILNSTTNTCLCKLTYVIDPLNTSQCVNILNCDTQTSIYNQSSNSCYCITGYKLDPTNSSQCILDTSIFSVYCYDLSQALSGIVTSTRVSDRPTLNASILNGTVNSSFTNAAIKTCVNNVTGDLNYGALLGHQIAIANFDGLTIGTKPLTSNLIWLPGVGQTIDIQGSVKCYTKYLAKGVILNFWSTGYNNLTGIYISNFTYSDGTILNYGNVPTSLPTGSTNTRYQFSFDANYTLSGIWGYQQTSLQALSIIALNKTKCLLTQTQVNPVCNNSNQEYDAINQQCICQINFVFDPNNLTNCVPIVQCDIVTELYNKTTNTCFCNTNYVIDPLNTTQCVKIENCDTQTSIYNQSSNSCYCITGYKLDPTNSSQCILDTSIYSVYCFDLSQALSGIVTSTKVSDRPSLNASILNGTVNSSFTNAAIKTCINNVTGDSNYGALLGHQIAIANFDGLTIGTKPLTSNLIWLPGVGQTIDIQGSVKCYTKYLAKGVILNFWSTGYNNLTGIYISNFTYSDGTILNYGKVPTSLPTGSTNKIEVFSFNVSNILSGVWGYQQTSLEALSVITYNKTRCPYNYKPSCNSFTQDYDVITQTCICKTNFVLDPSNQTNCVPVAQCDNTTEIYNSSTNSCNCNVNYTVDPQDATLCVLLPQCDLQSQNLNYTTNKCQCKPNYVVDLSNNNQCVPNAICDSQTSFFDQLTSNSCQCIDKGYILDPTNSSQCILDPSIFTISCFDLSTELSGIVTSTRVSDRPSLNASILNGTVNSSFTNAAIKTCVNNVTGDLNYGALLGHQIAIANFDGLTIGTKPLISNLIWLPGVGQTIDIQGSVKCYTKYLAKGVMLNTLQTAYNSQSGIFISNFTYSDGTTLNYGKLPTSFPSGSINLRQNFNFDTNKTLSAIWGYKQTSIEALSVITFNRTRCQFTQDLVDNNTNNTSNETQPEIIQQTNETVANFANCYDISNVFSGAQVGARVSDNFTLNGAIIDGSVTDTYYTAAIKTCSNNNATIGAIGKILGHQIAIANSIQTQSFGTLSSNLFWLPGVGATLDVIGSVKCETIFIFQDVFLTQWSVGYNTQDGIYISNFTFSDGQKFYYGVKPIQIQTGSTNNKTVYNFTQNQYIFGIWGYEVNNQIKGVSMITKNLTTCPLTQFNNNLDYDTQVQLISAQDNSSTSSPQYNFLIGFIVGVLTVIFVSLLLALILYVWLRKRSQIISQTESTKNINLSTDEVQIQISARQSLTKQKDSESSLNTFSNNRGNEIADSYQSKDKSTISIEKSKSSQFNL